MPERWSTERLVDEVAALAVRGLPREAFYRELVARIFLDDYLPHIERRTPLAAGGGFVSQ
ncbi:MAG TPA: hypothetical protein VH063_19140 [Gaiellaceae bacterium]|jgi:hypothetical protein|nr:hypothetical protein [Gaiellaceae bacterium]